MDEEHMSSGADCPWLTSQIPGVELLVSDRWSQLMDEERMSSGADSPPSLK